MFAIFKKEINSFFNSLVAYLVLATFFIFMGLIGWVLPDTSIFDYGFNDLSVLFSFAPYLFLFLIPAITMRSLSEEYRTGTFELNKTKPLTSWQIINGKFFASWLLVGLSLLPFFLYYYAAYQLGSPVGNIDTAGFFGSLFGLFVLGGVFTGIGLLCSAVTNNQIVAFILAALVSYFFYDGLLQLALLTRGTLFSSLELLSFQYHYDALSRGVIDTRNIIYFTSWLISCLLFTRYIVIQKTH